MKRYVLLVGGSGARVGESLLCAACAGVFQAEQLRVLLADTDHRGLRSAELLRAKYADYAHVQSAMAAREQQNAAVRPFRTAMTFAAWPERLTENAATLQQWTDALEADALLCQALFDEEAASLDLREGFHGRRMLGSTVFAGLLRRSAEERCDALAEMIADMQAALEAGEEVRCVAAGSVCGGTGAAGLPLLIRHIRETLGDRVQIGAVLLAASSDQEDPACAQETISAYAREGLCETVCILGLPRSSCVSAPADYAHLTDWLAVYCMDVLLHRPQWLRGVFSVKAESGPMAWSMFGKAGARYRVAYGGLIKAAAAWTGVLGPQVEKRLKHPSFLRDHLPGWYARYFRHAGEQRELLLAENAELTRLMSVVLLWLGGLCRTLPPEMRCAGEMQQAHQEARHHYDALTELVSQLAVMDAEAQQAESYEQSLVYRQRSSEMTDAEQTLRRIDAVKKEISRQEEAQERLNRRMGGAAAMQLLQEALEAAEAESAELHARYEEANRRIDHAERIAAPEDQYRITDARTRLTRMERHQRMLDARAARIREDVARATGQAMRYEKPQVQTDRAESGLFSAALTERLLSQERRLTRAEVEGMWPSILSDAQGMAWKKTLRAIRRERAEHESPVHSLMYALMIHAAEEV